MYVESDYRRQKKILRVMGVKKEDLERVDAIHTESREIVKADFEEIGSLIKNKSIPQKDFLKTYWSEVLKSWAVLYDEIQKIRIESDSGYMKNFSELKRHADEYRILENKPRPIVVEDIKKIKPAVEDFKLEVVGQEHKFSALFDIPIDVTKISEAVTLSDSNGNKIEGRVSWDTENNTAVLITTKLSSGTYQLKIDKVQDTKGSQMEEPYTKSFTIK